jgi:hypothetical protein
MPKDPIKTLEAIEKNLDRQVGQVLNEMAFRIRNRVKGPPGLLHWKSRRIPVVVQKAVPVGGVITSAVRGASGWKAAPVHIGPPGSTTITAKRGMLALPTDFVRKGFRGKAVGPEQYGGTKIFGGIIWGKAGWGGARTGGGLRQHRAAGEKFRKQDLVPLFILKKSVVVRRRIIPPELIRWIRPQLRAELAKKALKA